MTKLFLQRIRLSVKSLWSLLLQTLGFSPREEIEDVQLTNDGLRAFGDATSWGVLYLEQESKTVNLQKNQFVGYFYGLPTYIRYILPQSKAVIGSMTLSGKSPKKSSAIKSSNTPPTPKPNSGRKEPSKSSPLKKRKPSSSKRSSATPRKLTYRPQGRISKP